MEAHLIKTLFYFSSVLLLIFYFVVIFLYKIWLKPIYLERILRQQGIKGTPYKLFRGDMEEIRRSTMEALSKPMSLNHHIVPRVTPFLYDMVQKYGKVCMCWRETRPRLIIGDSELIRLILADKNGHFVKPPQNPLVDLLQLGITTLDGEQWSKRRRLMTPAFHLDKLKGMLPAFSTSCSALIDRWIKLTSFQGSTEVDVGPEFHILTGDVIARTTFGSSYEEGKRIFELQKEQFDLVLEAYNNIYVPGYRFVPTRKNRRRYKVDNEIKGILRDLIRRKKQAMQNEELDLLGLLLQNTKLGDQFVDDNNCLTIDDVIEECKLFYIAGQETTANLLTWTMIVLSIHPNWQEKAREEVLRLCGKETPNLDTIHHLKIVSMILNEVLRLYTPLGVHLRYTKQETNIGGMSIPAGVETVLCILSIHHDPKLWGDDAGEFNPERFSEGVAKSSKHDKIAFYPFGWGPRICLGQSFAMIESKMGLAMILQHFSFQLSPSYTHAPWNGITLQPQHGAPIILHRL
ncbi:Cytochrome P450, E-class, group I [Parasponia andersonii]|uniref:Cytochrome P450, E-class, group I n=1 Tax=Parasponia andersonii TaxID=3476 RepID=A0A2P5A9N9_PARAD|nr:Cytochrome P450, E-class, group I [Parasponia andersonii]